jgi:hypothetical protein
MRVFMRRFRCHRRGRSAATVVAFILLLGASAPRSTLAAREPAGDVQLSGVPAAGTHFYRMTTLVVSYEPDGRRHAPDVYDLWVEYALQPDGDVSLICHRFDWGSGDSSRAEIPSLRDWTYRTRLTESGLDQRGWIFGVDQSKFASLTDARGTTLPQGNGYCVFNAFVDFHSFADVFIRRADGGGIQDLRQMGQRIVHAAARRDAPISLEGVADKSSTFKLGEVTLELKGTSVVDGRRCALVGYDSGDASLVMTFNPAPQVTVAIHGGSHFFGDLYVDLATQALRKATLAEFVVQELSGAALPQTIHTVIERKLVLRELSQREFEASLRPGTADSAGSSSAH